MTTPKSFAPIKFSPSTLSCICADGREIMCQKVEQQDYLSFQFNPDLCTDNLVECGEFETSSCASSEWATTGWTYSSGQMNHVTGSTNSLKQSAIVTSGNWYKVTFTVKRVTNPLIEVLGSVTCKLGTASSSAIAASGTYTQYILSNGTDLLFTPTSNFDGAIDDVSVYQINSSNIVYLIDSNGNAIGSVNPATGFANGIAYYNELWASFEVPDGCYQVVVASECSACDQYGNLISNGTFSGGTSPWEFDPTQWTLSSGKMCHFPTGVGTLQQTINCLAANKKYTVRFTLSNVTAGKITVTLGGTLDPMTFTTNGIFEVDITTINTGDLIFTPDSNFDGCLDDIQIYLHIDSYPRTLISGCYELATNHDCTSLLEWTNYNDAFGFDYTSFNVPLKHRLRLSLILHKPKYANETKNFKDSAGNFTRIYGEFTKQWEAISVEQPEYIHDAIACGIQHDLFYIDGERYITDGNYSPNFENGFNFADVIFMVGKTPDDNINTNCND